MNMYKWIERMIYLEERKAFPLLSFPSVQILYVTVKELVTNSNYQALGMKMIADRYDMPAVPSFMDLSVEAEAFGSRTVYQADEVPTIIGKIIEDEEDLEKLKKPKVGDGRTGIYVEGTRKAMKLITDRPVFGGCTGPFSLAGRLMDINEIMMLCYEEPELVHSVLRRVTDFLIEYVKAYKDIGAQGVIMAEPLAGVLSPQLAQEFSTEYVKEIVGTLQDQNFIIIYHNCGNYTIQLIDTILDTGCRMFHFGDSIDMAEMMKLIPPDCIAMGNVSPARHFRNGTPQSVRNATIRLLEACGRNRNFMVSSGCDIPPLTEFENIDAFFETVESYYYRQRLLDLIM